MKLIAPLAFCLTVSVVPSFGAEHPVGHSTTVAPNDSYEAAEQSVKEIGRFLKFVF